MKIIFLTTIPLIKQHLNDSYINTISLSYNVELWDLSEIYSRNDLMSDLIEDVVTIKSTEEFDNKLKEQDQEILIITNTLIYTLKKIYMIIKKHNIDIVTISKEGFVEYLFNHSSYKFKHSKSFIERMKYIKNNVSFIRKAYNRVKNGKTQYDFLLGKGNYFPENNKQFHSIHHIKYDEFLKNKCKERVVNKRYAVFLDSGVPNHPIYDRFISDERIDPQKYLELVNNFLNFIEREYGIEIIVSSHPKANYSSNDFNGRQIIKYQTANLIEYCDFVISHYSTSVINAVLSNKPIIFVYYKEMLTKAECDAAIGGIELSKILNSALIDLENYAKVNISINPKSYEEFKYRHIVNRTDEDRSNEDLIIEFLREYEIEKNKK